jgi:hypothetical protein
MMPVIEFLPKIFLADVTIFCVSEPYRFVNKHNLPINFLWTEQMMKQKGTHWEERQATADKHNIPLSKMMEMADAADMYYKYLFNQSSVELFQIGLVSFIDNLMKQYNKKTIWFPCFKQSFQLPIEFWKPEDSKPPMTRIDKLYHKVTNKQYIPISGPSANIPLHELSIAELQYEKNTPDEITYITQNDLRRNHFNKEHNYKMAELILNIIETDNFLPEVIKIEDYFSHLNLDKAEAVRE